MNYDRPELRDRLAAEYVLGTLHGRARARFQRLMRSNLKVRVAVELWEQKLVPMGAPLSVPPPSANLWKGIEARIDSPVRGAVAGRGDEKPSFFDRWFGWRTLGALATGLFMGIGAMLVVPTLQQKPPQLTQLPESYAGFLQDAQGNATMLVSSLRHGLIVDIKVLRPIPVQSDQMLVLWALPKDAAPFALGVVPGTGKGRVTLPAPSEQLLSTITELAVSVEPKASAPGPAPSGPFVIRGPCAKFW